ncbi:MAG: SGNH/GDSL hydrolase family protein [Chitinophagaceae bacterium]|nr:MAG: SGNH/GDSL hydrolase family protein [Chitinophagaceae bacterium]
MKKVITVACIVLLCISFQKKEITWVAIGDSITYLNEHPDETGNRVTKGYLTLVTEKLPSIKYINQGHNGWTSAGIADKIEELKLTSADVYTVFLGTNDWWQGKAIGTIDDYRNNTGTKTLYGSFRVIINKLRQLNPKAKIILITPLQRSDFVYINNMKNNAWGSFKAKNGQTLAAFAEAIKQIGKAGKFDVVDLYNKSGITQKNIVNFKRLRDPQSGAYKNYKYPEFTTVPFNPETDEYPYPPEAINMTYDGLHPSDKGNKIIAGMLIKLLD